MSGATVLTAAHSMWEYGRRELPYLARALMELSLFVPFCLAFMPWARYWSVPQFFVLLLLLMLIPFNLMRVMSLLGVPLNQQRAILMGGLLVALGVVMRMLLYEPVSLFDLRWIGAVWRHLGSAGYPFWTRDFAILGIVTYLWWRGIRLINRPRDIETVGLQFRIRALIFAPLVAYLASFRLHWSIVPFMLLFCFASLVVLALTRAEQVEEQATGLAFPVTPRWLGVVGLCAAVIVCLGLLAASSTTAESIFGPPQTAVRLTAYTVFHTFTNLVGPPFFAFFEWLSLAVERIMEPLAAMLANLEFEIAGSGDQALPNEEGSSASSFWVNLVGLMVNITTGLILILFFTLIVLGLLASVRMVKNLQQRSETVVPPGEAERPDESVGIWGRLRNVIPRFRAWRTAASIRRIYRQMVLAATAVGHSRHAAETPYEYLTRLREAFPQNVTDVTLITDAYVRSHYGEVPETRSELDKIYAAWKNFDEHIREANS